MNNYPYSPYYYGYPAEPQYYPQQPIMNGYHGYYGQVGYPYYPGSTPAPQVANAVTPTQNQTGSLISNPRFIKGALIGAAAAYLLTNESVQQGAIKGAVKTWSLLQGGIEEMKERFRDAEAELHATDFED